MYVFVLSTYTYIGVKIEAKPQIQCSLNIDSLPLYKSVSVYFGKSSNKSQSETQM